jgi:alkylation response protein AidB-like acyl-CoA dehydrogenase
MIDLLPCAEQQQIIDSLADFLASELPVERLRTELRAPERDERCRWRELAAQGWFGLALEGSLGGAGFTLIEEMLAHREFGRFLLSPRVLGATLAAHAAVAAGNQDLARSIVEGERCAALASLIGTVSIGMRVSGELHLIDSLPGDLLVLWNEDGLALIERDNLAEIRSVAALDGSVHLERAHARGAIAHFVPTATAPLRRRAGLLIAAQLAAMAKATCDMSVEFAKTRIQFGKPIGAFQAVAHHCADMALRSRAALAQTAFAAVAARDGRPDATFQVCAAAIVASDAAQRNATIAIRIHGGMGFTAECDVHHYLKRAHLLDRLNGGLRKHQTELLAEPTANSSPYRE